MARLVENILIGIVTGLVVTFSAGVKLTNASGFFDILIEILKTVSLLILTIGILLIPIWWVLDYLEKGRKSKI